MRNLIAYSQDTVFASIEENRSFIRKFIFEGISGTAIDNAVFTNKILAGVLPVGGTQLAINIIVNCGIGDLYRGK